MSEFWQSVMQQIRPEPAIPMANGEAYRAWQRSKPGNGASGSAIYDAGYLPPTSEQRNAAIIAAQSAHYETVAYQGLGSYVHGEPASKWAQSTNESDASYLARTGVVLRHLDSLPEPDRDLILSTRQAISERQLAPEAAWDAHRKITDAHQAGMGGVQQLGNHVEAGHRFGGGQVEKLGGIAVPAPLAGVSMMSNLEAMQIVREREEARQGQPPQHQDVSTLRSSGTGWVGVG